MSLTDPSFFNAAGYQYPGGMTAVAGNQPLTVKMCEFRTAVLPPGTIAPGVQTLTWIWGYLVDPDPAGKTPCATLAAKDTNPVTGSVDTYIGPVIVNDRGRGSTPITWVNELGNAATTNVLAYRYSTDQTIHWADPMAPQLDGQSNMCMMRGALKLFPGGLDYPPFGNMCAQNYDGPVAALPHLHGGEQPAEIDGSPDSWFTSDGAYRGHKYYTRGVLGEVLTLPSLPNVAYPPGSIVFSFDPALSGWVQNVADVWMKYTSNASLYTYPNLQEAAPLWFHDHTLGATRLNVYMGLAGVYYLRDANEALPANLPPLEQVVPIVLQDRMFEANGELFFPADSAGGLLWSLNPEHPYWVPEFVGDTIVVNGKAWPYLNVEPRRYRFLFLNGSNARTYEMFLVNPVTKIMGPPLYVIGTDGGYLDAPAVIDPNTAKPAQNRLVIQPGERYEVIVDFGAVAPGTNLVLRNVAKTPYPAGTAPQGSTLGQLIRLVPFTYVRGTASGSFCQNA